MAQKMNTQTLLLLTAVVGLGLFFLLRKNGDGVSARAPAVGVSAGVPSVTVPAMAPLPAGCTGQMIMLAEQQLGLSRDQLTVRSLRPNDVGLGNTWSMDLAVANSWNTTVNSAVADNTFICLNSVSYSGTDAEAIRVTAGASVVAEFNIQRIPGISTTQTIRIPDIIIEQNEPIRIEVYASAISATDAVIISGTVVEKMGLLLGV